MTESPEKEEISKDTIEKIIKTLTKTEIEEEAKTEVEDAAKAEMEEFFSEDPNNKHFLILQDCFDFPGPPNIFMSWQFVQEPQLALIQLGHVPHFVFFFGLSMDLTFCSLDIISTDVASSCFFFPDLACCVWDNISTILLRFFFLGFCFCFSGVFLDDDLLKKKEDLERFFFGDILVQHKTMFVTTSQLLVD